MSVWTIKVLPDTYIIHTVQQFGTMLPIGLKDTELTLIVSSQPWIAKDVKNAIVNHCQTHSQSWNWNDNDNR